MDNMISEIQSKLKNGEVLSEAEQREFFASVQTGLDRMKNENPEEYLKILNDIDTSIAELVTELDAVSGEQKN